MKKIKMKWREEDIQRVLEYLNKKTGLFIEVRNKFQINDSLALVCAPERHKYSFSPGVLSKVLMIDGGYYFDDPTPQKLDSSRIVVGPVGRLIKNTVSVYFAPGVAENKKGVFLEEKYFSAPDEVIKGLLAHECAEYLLYYGGTYLKYEYLSARSSPKDQDISSHLIDQCPADLLACLFGYKKEMVALLNFGKEILQGWEDFPLGLYRPPRVIVKELNARLEFIEMSRG